MRARAYAALGLSVVLAAGACTRPIGAPLPPRGHSGERSPSTALGPGDRLMIRVFGEDNLTGEYRVGDNGEIDFPYLGAVRVLGLQASETASLIQRGLGPTGHNVLRSPSVSVAITEVVSRPVSVLGQVQHPGVFQYTQHMTLAQVISQAGGFTAIAAKGQVRVTRHVTDPQTQAERSVTYVLDVDRILEGRAPDFDLRPFDVIFVPESLT